MHQSRGANLLLAGQLALLLVVCLQWSQQATTTAFSIVTSQSSKNSLSLAAIAPRSQPQPTNAQSQPGSQVYNGGSDQTTSHQQASKQQEVGVGTNEHTNEDSVPLATINNHSHRKQTSRPHQYVDVSALVGVSSKLVQPPEAKVRANDLTQPNVHQRNANASQSSQVSNNGSSSSSSSLSGKSRSSLPECATQQVCNAIFVRMNYTQRLCECSANYDWKCSNNLDPQDGHTIELTRKFDKRIYTQIKTCEPLREVRACKQPTDWTLLALQSERSGKAHYVVVCKCPNFAQLEGPYTHNHPPYANIPGIRVYGMLCVHQTARSSSQTYSAYNPTLGVYPEFPWSEALNVLNTTNLATNLDAAH